MFFTNFEGLAVKSLDDIEKIRTTIEAHLAPLNKKVFGIVNYDNFSIRSELTDVYGDMVQQLGPATTTASPAIRRAASCGSSWAKRYSTVTWPLTSTRAPRKHGPTCASWSRRSA